MAGKCPRAGEKVVRIAGGWLRLSHVIRRRCQGLRCNAGETAGGRGGAQDARRRTVSTVGRAGSALAGQEECRRPKMEGSATKPGSECKTSSCVGGGSVWWVGGAGRMDPGLVGGQRCGSVPCGCALERSRVLVPGERFRGGAVPGQRGGTVRGPYWVVCRAGQTTGHPRIPLLGLGPPAPEDAPPQKYLNRQRGGGATRPGTEEAGYLPRPT